MRAVIVHAPHDLRVERTTLDTLGPGDVRVRVEAGGICGSDLHYFHAGGFGAVRIKEPMILGHEIAGRVEAVGAEVSNVAAGDLVAVSPSLPCEACRYCRQGRQAHCLDMRFYGSAMRFPHVQGAFRDAIVCRAVQAHRVASGVSASEAAFAEPLAVCLHAVSRAGPLLGQQVLVTGCGPIGVLTIMAAKLAGAARIVATDLSAVPLAAARSAGADEAVDVAAEPRALERFHAEKGAFDVMFECSGNGQALVGAFAALRPRAVIVQVGTGGDYTIPVSMLVAKEFDWRGTFRFHEEFALAVDLIGRRRVEVRPLLTATLPVERAVEAFELASDRTRAMKVQLAFD